MICNEDDTGTFKLLLTKGADPDFKDPDGESGRSLAMDNLLYKNDEELVASIGLAKSMTLSEYETTDSR